MAERLVFQHTVEGLFVAFRDAVDERLKQKLLGVGLDLDHVPHGLPATVYGAAYEVLRERVYPGVDEKKAGLEMGARFLDGYFSTVMGGVVRTLLRFLSIEKVIERASQNLASGANFIDARVESLGPKLWQVWMSDYSTSPYFLAGVMKRMMELAGAKDVSLELVNQEGRELTFRCSWH